MPKTLNDHDKDLPALTLVSKSIDIKAPVETVFTYFARPEHVSDQLKDQERVGMTVIPMDIKDGMGVGTTFRIIGDFDGKRITWDCETTQFVRNEKISAKAFTCIFFPLVICLIVLCIFFDCGAPLQAHSDRRCRHHGVSGHSLSRR